MYAELTGIYFTESSAWPALQEKINVYRLPVVDGATVDQMNETPAGLGFLRGALSLTLLVSLSYNYAKGILCSNNIQHLKKKKFLIITVIVIIDITRVNIYAYFL